jgi:hypothetical protein
VQFLKLLGDLLFFENGAVNKVPKPVTSQKFDLLSSKRSRPPEQAECHKSAVSAILAQNLFWTASQRQEVNTKLEN